MTNNCAQITCILVTKPNLSHDITTFYKTRTGGSITGGMAKYVSNTVQFKKFIFAWDVEKKDNVLKSLQQFRFVYPNIPFR